jgi:hypothetical protein
MDPDVTTFAQVAVVIVFLAASMVTIGLVAFKTVTHKRPPAQYANLNDARLEQLQQSIDAIAVEVERIAEAQRFSAKLLAERNDATTVAR